MNESRMNIFLKIHQLQQQQQQQQQREVLIHWVDWTPSSSQVTDLKSSLTKKNRQHSTEQRI